MRERGIEGRRQESLICFYSNRYRGGALGKGVRGTAEESRGNENKLTTAASAYMLLRELFSRTLD